MSWLPWFDRRRAVRAIVSEEMQHVSWDRSVCDQAIPLTRYESDQVS